MARPRPTFAKRARELANQAKAQAKQERRRSKSTDQAPREDEVDGYADNQDELLAQLAALQQAFEAHEIGFEEFEIRRDELRSKIRV